MSWADILYPGNQERRNNVVRKLQQLEDAMNFNFKASNKLAAYLNKTIPDAKFPMIYVDTSKTLKENASMLVNQINQIDSHLENIDEELKEKLEPELYKKVTNVDISFEERIQIIQKLGKVTAGITTSVVMGVVGRLVAKRLAKTMLSKAARIAGSVLAGAIVGAIAGEAVDAIIGAITGAIERSKLEDALRDLQDMVTDFIPASEDYTETIFEVLAEVKNWESHHLGDQK